jgi:hypothetical protein
MRQRRPGASTALALSTLALGAGLLLVAGATPALAQRAAGIGEDAFVLPRGGFRLTLAPTFENVDQRLLPGGDRVPLGSLVSGTYDLARLPLLRPAQDALESIIGAGGLLSLGQVRVVADQRAAILPLSLEYGLGARIQVGVTVPWVRTTTNVVAFANDTGTFTASAGLNPALASANDRTRNTSLVGQMLTAARNREAILGLPTDGCAGSSVEGCAAVNDARAAATALATLYGTGTDDALPAELSGLAGAAAVPVAGGALAEGVDARIDALRTALGAEGSVITIDSPSHATAPIGAAGLATLLGDEASGLGLDAFRAVQRSHLGDIEGMLKIALIDGIGRMGQAPARPVGVRLSVAGVFRAPTGQAESPGNALDLGTGDGQTDVEARGALDLTFGRAVWISAAARAVVQLEDRQYVAAPQSLAEIPLVPRRAVVLADRDLGDAVAFEVTPRWLASEYMTVSATYQVRRKDVDTYTLSDVGGGDPGLPDGRDVALLGQGTDFTEQRVGFGLTWSTLGAARRGKRTMPLDVSYVHLRTLVATGNAIPLTVTDQLRLRLWFGRTGPAR